MSSANTGNSTNERYTPKSSEQKLERQLASVKAGMHSVSVAPNPWAVKKDPKLGVHYMLLLGKAEAGFMNHLVLHRLIGQDYKINKKEDWVMSLASDIPGYLETAEFSGKSKVIKALGTLKSKIAVNAGLIEIDEFDKEKYVSTGDFRKDILDNARTASTAHAGVTGKAHFGEWLLYLAPEHVKLEIQIQNAIQADPEYHAKAHDALAEYAGYQTSLIDGKHQQKVPYLHGVAEKDVLRTVYSAVIGVVPMMEDKMPEQAGVFPFKIYSDYVAGDESMRQTLVRELQVHAISVKEMNVAKSESDGAKLKEQKAEKIKVWELKKRELVEATNRILSIEKQGKYPTIVDKVEHEVYVDPMQTPKQIFETLKASE